MTEIVLTIIGSGIISTVVSMIFGRRKNNAEAAKGEAEVQKSLLDLKTEVAKDLQGEFNKMCDQVVEKTKEVIRLNEEKESLSALLSKSEKDNKYLRKKYEDHTLRIAELERELKELRDQIKMLTDEKN